MELRQYLAIARRWAWLLLLGLVLGVAGGFAGSYYQTPIYEAGTRILVMRAASQAGTNDLSYLNDQQLAQTYIQLLTTRPVLDAAASRLGYPIDEEQLRVQQIGTTQVIQLTVEDPDPAHATDIANMLIQALIDQNETLQTGRYASTEESLQAQIGQVQTQINSLQSQIDSASNEALATQLSDVQAQINTLQTQITTLQNEVLALKRQVPNEEQKAALDAKQAELDRLQPVLALYQQIYTNLVVLGKPVEGESANTTRMSQLEKTLSLYQQIYINLLTSIESVRLARLQNTPNVVQIEPATRPGQPIRPRPIQNTLLAGAVGLMLAAGIVFLIEYLDDTLKTPEDVERVLGLPVLGFVAEMRPKRKSAEEVYIMREPRSPVSEAFRSLRTNMEFAGVEKPITTILVTSPGPGEGKTTVAVNLAAIFSQAKKRTVLIDGDMRRPHVHLLMGFSNREGLSTLFLNPARMSNVGRVREDLPHLLVITSGDLPPNPAELLGSNRMGQILESMRRNVDMVIIDAPPSLVADAQILSARVDAVLMVIQPGITHGETARASLEMFQRAGARVVGVVMNRIPRNRGYYYGGYKNYSPYGDGKAYFSGNGSKPAREGTAGKPARKPEEKTAEHFLERMPEPIVTPAVEASPSTTHSGGLFDKMSVAPPKPTPLRSSDHPK